MGTILTAADEVYRDYNVDDVPSSGPWTPTNEDVLGLWGTVDSIVSALMTVGAVIIEDTLAHLSANLVPAAPAFARVVADGTPANDGWYSKVGATGVGSWTFLGADVALAAATAAAASATAAAASAVTAAAALNSLDATVTQLIGRPVNPIAGGAVDTGTYLVNNPAIAAGVLSTLVAWVLATGNITLAVYSKSGSTFTRTAESTFAAAATGLQTFTSASFGALAVGAGDYIGVSAVGVLGANTNTDAPEGLWGVGASAPSSGTGALFAGLHAEAQFYVAETVQTVTAASFAPVQQQTAGGGALTLGNVDKIVVVSNSYYESAMCLLGKGPVSNVSNLSDYNFGNFSQGGQTVANLIALMENGTTEFGATFAQLGATWAILSEWVNSKVNAGQTDAVYFADYLEWVQQTRGLGVQPIVASEFFNASAIPFDGEAGAVKGLRALADQTGAVFIDATSKARTMDPAIYAPFWETNHPGTRMCYLISDGILRGLAQLPPPLQSMKLFRVRGTVTVSGVASLMYANVQQRAHLFRELYIGHLALSNTENVDYDTAIALDSSVQTQADEYLALNAGGSVALGAYALIECVLPVLNPAGLTLTLSDPTCTVYARQFLAGASTWVLLQLVNGVYVVQGGDSCVDLNRACFLIYKSGGISLDASPIVAWTSGRQRLRAARALPAPPRGGELLAAPFTVISAAVPGAWANAGALSAIGPIDGAAYLPGANQTPPGTTGCVEVTSAAGLAQDFTYASSDDPQEVVVRVWARTWRAIFANTGSFSAAPITYETCDTSTLQVSLCGVDGLGVASATFTDQVGLAWKECEFRCSLEALTTTGLVDVRSQDNTIQISKVSVRLA